MENDDFLIPLKGLTRTFRFARHVDGKFFESFGNGEILDASLEAEVDATRSGSCIDVDCTVTGSVTTLCDRCLGEMEIPVDVDIALRYGREDDLSDGDDGFSAGDGDFADAAGLDDEEALLEELFGSEREEIVLQEGQAEIDLRQVIYDYVCLSLPLRKVHEEGGCDPEVIRRLNENAAPDAVNEDDPRDADRRNDRDAEKAGAKNGCRTQKADARDAENPFAALKGLFKDEN